MLVEQITGNWQTVACSGGIQLYAGADGADDIVGRWRSQFWDSTSI